MVKMFVTKSRGKTKGRRQHGGLSATVRRRRRSLKCVLEFAEAPGLRLLRLLIGFPYFLSVFGLLVPLFNGGLYGAELEELLPLVNQSSVGQPLLLLGCGEEHAVLDGRWSNNTFMKGVVM